MWIRSHDNDLWKLPENTTALNIMVSPNTDGKIYLLRYFALDNQKPATIDSGTLDEMVSILNKIHQRLMREVAVLDIRR